MEEYYANKESEKRTEAKRIKMKGTKVLTLSVYTSFKVPHEKAE